MRTRKIEKGTSGARERSSIATKAPSRSSAATIVPIVWAEPQPADSASSRAKTKAERPSVIVIAPATSKWRVSASASVSAIRLGAIAAATMPIGTFTQSTHSQPMYSVRTPPSSTPGGAAGAGHRAPDPERFVALGAVFEGDGDDRERGGGEDRGAEALDRAGGDQLARVGGEAARQRGEREEHQPGHEEAPPPEQVGEPAAEQQEAAEGEHVGVHAPRAGCPRRSRALRSIVGSATLTIEASRTTTNWATQSSTSAIQRLSRASATSVTTRPRP